MKNIFLTIEDLKINDYSLDVDYIKNISIYNDIENVGMSLSMIIDDITDIKNKLPLKGGETLTFKAIQQDKTTVSKDFILNSVTLINARTDRNNLLSLKFVSKESIFLLAKKDYKYYENTSGYDIIKNYISDLDGSSSEKFNILIPGYNYIKAIQYINEFTHDYVFENFDGYKYRVLEDLLISSDKTLVFESNNTWNKNLIQSFEEIEVVNTIADINNNIYDNTILSYNPNTKKILNKNTKIEELQTNKKTLGSGENYSDEIKENSNTNYEFIPFYDSVLDTTNYEEIFNKQYDLLLLGDFNLEVGNTLNILFRDRFNSNPNPMLNGVWLITKVAHHMDNDEFMSKIRVTKNAFYKGDITNNSII